MDRVQAAVGATHPRVIPHVTSLPYWALQEEHTPQGKAGADSSLWPQDQPRQYEWTLVE